MAGVGPWNICEHLGRVEDQANRVEFLLGTHGKLLWQTASVSFMLLLLHTHTYMLDLSLLRCYLACASYGVLLPRRLTACYGPVLSPRLRAALPRHLVLLWSMYVPSAFACISNNFRIYISFTSEVLRWAFI